MNDAENSASNGPVTPDFYRDLQEEIHLLRRQLMAVVVVIVALNLSLNIYLLRQIMSFRAQRIQLVTEYKQKWETPMNDALKRLREFGQANPDYVQVLGKIGLVTNLPAVNAAPATGVKPAAPAPAATPPKKAN